MFLTIVVKYVSIILLLDGQNVHPPHLIRNEVFKADLDGKFFALL